MKALIFVLVLLGSSGVIFGAWGVYTSQGRAKFDEMDGIIPYFSGIVGGVLIIIAVVLIVFRRWVDGSRG
jgi:TRAP-type C4-dicarboxylate transport system permease small subunit